MAELDRTGAEALARSPRVARLLAILESEGESARIVGGAVRNALLGRPVHDVDIATGAVPEAILRAVRKAGLRAIPTGIDHGTVTVLVEGQPFEVTTLREDVETDGRRAVVRFGRDFAADAARRDFTINALSVDREGLLRDEVGGLADLAAGRVRFIGEPRRRIREDYLRILRFFRFQADYGAGEADPEGLAAAIAERDGLTLLSRERVRAELLRLLGARRASETVALLAETGLLARLTGGGVGELGRLSRVAAAEGTDPDPVRRLAALLVRIEEDSDRLQDALRLSKGETARLAAYGRAVPALASSPAPLGAGGLRALAARLGLPALLDAFAAIEGEPRPALAPAARELLGRYRRGEEAEPVFPLTGADLVRRGFPAGPALGRKLAEARRRWLAAGCPPDWTDA